MRPSGRSAGMSFRLWTAASTRLSRSASSISLTKSALPPKSARATSASRSPVVARARRVAELHGGAVQDLVDESLGEGLERLARGGVGPGEPGEGPGDLGAADLLELLAQGDDGRDHLQVAQARGELG